MDIMTSIPVRLIDSERATLLLEQVRERIAQRAYENFIERGGLDGHDVDDWLNAERELVVKPAARVHATRKPSTPRRKGRKGCEGRQLLRVELHNRLAGPPAKSRV
jgi:hypothetical protein